MTPEFAAARPRAGRGRRREAGREPPPVFGYVRTAVGPDAAERLAKEESFYRDLHDGYRNHFARLGEPEGTVGVAAADREGVAGRARRYEALDVVVVRGLASATLEAMTAVAEAAAPADAVARPPALLGVLVAESPSAARLQVVHERRGAIPRSRIALLLRRRQASRRSSRSAPAAPRSAARSSSIGHVQPVTALSTAAGPRTTRRARGRRAQNSRLDSSESSDSSMSGT